jgi:hypothetical protein
MRLPQFSHTAKPAFSTTPSSSNTETLLPSEFWEALNIAPQYQHPSTWASDENSRSLLQIGQCLSAMSLPHPRHRSSFGFALSMLPQNGHLGLSANNFSLRLNCLRVMLKSLFKFHVTQTLFAH